MLHPHTCNMRHMARRRPAAAVPIPRVCQFCFYEQATLGRNLCDPQTSGRRPERRAAVGSGVFPQFPKRNMRATHVQRQARRRHSMGARNEAKWETNKRAIRVTIDGKLGSEKINKNKSDPLISRRECYHPPCVNTFLYSKIKQN